jgi:hypothetical protein
MIAGKMLRNVLMSKPFNNSTKHNEKRRSVYRKTKIVITYSEKEGYRGYKWAGKFVECNEVLRNYLLTEVRIKELFPATSDKTVIKTKSNEQTTTRM